MSTACLAVVDRRSVESTVEVVERTLGVGASIDADRHRPRAVAVSGDHERDSWAYQEPLCRAFGQQTGQVLSVVPQHDQRGVRPGEEDQSRVAVEVDVIGGDPGQHHRHLHG